MAITPTQARLVLLRADVEKQIGALEAGQPFRAVGRPMQRSEAVTLHHKRMAMCDQLMAFDEVALESRLVELVRQLSPIHCAVWLCELTGTPVMQEDQAAAWTEADFTLRVELDLILSATTEGPKAWLQKAGRLLANVFLAAARGERAGVK